MGKVCDFLPLALLLLAHIQVPFVFPQVIYLFWHLVEIDY